MPQTRNSAWLVVPLLLLVVLYLPGLTTWFYQDDFGWLNLRHDVHSVRDLAAAPLAPKAHGNMRPLGENAYWLGLGAIFGVEPLPFHICTFLTQAASLLLLGSIVRRLVEWAPAGLCAQILWLINPGLAPAMGWSSIYNQVLSAFFFLLAFYFLLRHIETGRRAHEAAHWAAFVLGLGAAVPSIGIAMLGAYALGNMMKFGVVGRPAVVLVIVGYAAISLPTSWTVTQWQHARGERVEDLVLGVEEIHQAAPGKMILLEGIDSELFWSGVADLPFRAKSIPAVYLAPGSETQAAPEILSKYVLPQAIARRALEANRAVVYRFDGQMLHNETAHAGAQWTDDEPRFVSLGDPVFDDYVGAGWREASGGRRRMDGTGTVRIAGPRDSHQSLYIGVFETRDFLPRIRANGVEVPTALGRRDIDLSEFRDTLPPEALQWKRMEVTVESSLPALCFGYVEVR